MTHPTTSDISEALWEEAARFGFRPTVDEQVAIATAIRDHARRIPTSASISAAIRAVGLHGPRGYAVAVRNRLARLYPEQPR